MAGIKDLLPQTTAFVFPGQGSQVVGMGRDLAEAFPAARRIFEEVDASLGFRLSDLMWNGPAEALNETINTQPALFTHSLAAFRTFHEKYPDFRPALLAGHSLGELSALAAGGALSVERAVRLVRLRGELMKKAGDRNPGGMAAILNVDIPTLEQICSSASTPQEPVQVANDNSPGQVVISGARAAVERAMELAKAAGARRAIPLAVSIAAHSGLMDSIQDEWNQAVIEAGIGDSMPPVIGNVEATVIRSGADLSLDIQRQMQSRVRWTESVLKAHSEGIDTFVEVGTGSVLQGLIKRVVPEATGMSLGKTSDFAALE